LGTSISYAVDLQSLYNVIIIGDIPRGWERTYVLTCKILFGCLSTVRSTFSLWNRGRKIPGREPVPVRDQIVTGSCVTKAKLVQKWLERLT